MKSNPISQALILMGRAASAGFPISYEKTPKGFDARALLIMRAAQASMNTGTVGWLSENSPYGAEVAAYFGDLRANSAAAAAIGRALLTVVPFRRAIAASTSNATAWLEGEGKPIPLSSIALDRRVLTEQKVCALLVASNELVNVIGDMGNQFLESQLNKAAGVTLDAHFRDILIDSSVAGTASAGATAANAWADIKAALNAVFPSGNTARQGFWIAGTDVLIGASTLTDTTGANAFGGTVGVNGGTLAGLPIFPSSAWPSEHLTLIDGARVVGNLDDMGLAASTATAVEMSTAPVQDLTQGSGVALTSMFQAGSIAMKQILRCGFERASEAAIFEVVGVAW
jgi:hypothetical protein